MTNGLSALWLTVLERFADRHYTHTPSGNMKIASDVVDGVQTDYSRLSEYGDGSQSTELSHVDYSEHYWSVH